MPETTSPRTVFVSHAHADNELCDRYVSALRAHGLDVWYDRSNMQVGHSLSSDIEAELRRRTVFVVMATPASLASQWVRSEIAAFRSLAAKDPIRLFLPVRVADCDMPLLWADILWIDAVSLGFDAAVDAMGVALGTAVAVAPTPTAEPPSAAPSPTPQPTESVHELRVKSASLIQQNKYAEAVPLLERATKLDTRSVDVWGGLAAAYLYTRRSDDALTGCDHALALTDKNSMLWFIKGTTLYALDRDEEALVAFDRSLALDPTFDGAWSSKAAALHHLGREAEAEEAQQRAQELGYKAR